MTEEFKEWIKEEYPKGDFEELKWEMQWGIYQLYFWEKKKWWISIYPYTDKFGGKIREFWGEKIVTRNFITNNPAQAQEKLVIIAFEKLIEDENRLTIEDFIKINEDKISTRLKKALHNSMKLRHRKVAMVFAKELTKEEFLKIRNAGIKSWNELEPLLAHQFYNNIKTT